MDEDWWPEVMLEVKNWAPWSDPRVTVAEYRTFDADRRPGNRMLWSALISEEELRKLDGRLIKLAHKVETNGPRPSYSTAGSYVPRFSVDAFLDNERISCEPLVLGWEANNHTTMVLDPGFAMTYGLISRAMAGGAVHWDNPSEPEFDIAIVGPPSVYRDLVYTPSNVVVARDYLQDYLTLRGKHLVHVYYECRYADQDAAIELLLQGENRKCEKLLDREVDVMRDEAGGFFVQIWGARYIAGPDTLPISSDTLDDVGLTWPGMGGPVTNQAARKLRYGHDLVYVQDAVLGAYEGRTGFSVSAERGSVSYGHQWSVSRTARVGRDVIQLELRKLYEGAPPRVIRHWHMYAIEPSPQLFTTEARRARHIGNRARAIVEGMVAIGEALVALSSLFELKDPNVSDIIGLDPKQLQYEGWWSGPHIEPITHHIPRDLTQQQFLQRCLDLDKVINEPLSERWMRALVSKIGEQPDASNSAG